MVPLHTVDTSFIAPFVCQRYIAVPKETDLRHGKLVLSAKSVCTEPRFRTLLASQFRLFNVVLDWMHLYPIIPPCPKNEMTSCQSVLLLIKLSSHQISLCHLHQNPKFDSYFIERTQKLKMKIIDLTNFSTRECTTLICYIFLCFGISQ
jgi:hypothetical protein